MNTLKIVTKTLGVVSVILAFLYAIGRIDYEKKQHEGAMKRNAELRRKNRQLFDTFNHAMSHVPREDRQHIIKEIDNLKRFENVIRNFDK